MKIFILNLAIFLNYFGCAYAQQTNSSKPAPLFLIDTFVTQAKHLVLDENKVKSVTVLKIKTAIKRYGDRGKNGVILVHTKGKINFMRLNALLDKYNFPDSLRNLRVCINEVISERPDLILVDESEVAGLSIYTATRWDILKNPHSEKFINITSKKKNL